MTSDGQNWSLKLPFEIEYITMQQHHEEVFGLATVNLSFSCQFSSFLTDVLVRFWLLFSKLGFAPFSGNIHDVPGSEKWPVFVAPEFLHGSSHISIFFDLWHVRPWLNEEWFSEVSIHQCNVDWRKMSSSSSCKCWCLTNLINGFIFCFQVMKYWIWSSNKSYGVSF